MIFISRGIPDFCFTYTKRKQIAMKKVYFNRTKTSAFLLLFGLFSALWCEAQSLCFDPAADNRYETSNAAYASAVADFNNDGDSDLVVVSTGSFDLLLGNSDGTFQPRQVFSTGLSSVCIGAADFNNDNRPDVVTFNQDADDVSLFINNGSGGFNNPISFQFGTASGTGLYISDMRLVDFNNDGKKDLVINDKDDDRVYILKNNGNSTFTVTDTLITGDNPNSLAVGDLNNDNRPDILVGYGYGTSSNDSISFFMNNGTGLFGNRSSLFILSFATNQRELAIDKINSDNFGDIIAHEVTELGIWLNNGSQVFTHQPTVFVGAYSTQIVTADFNGDNKKDLAVGDYNGQRVCVALGNGNGTFQNYVAYSAGGRCNHILLSDFDADGRADLISSNLQPDGNIAFLKGQTDGSFGSYSLRTGQRPSAIAVGLVNNDAFEDIVVVHDQQKTISTMLGNADGTFQNTIYDTAFWSMSSIELGDFNNDGKSDVVAVGPSTEILSGNNTGHFAQQGNILTGFAGGGDYSSAAGDFNHDTFLDLAVTYSNQDSASVLLGNGDFTFAPAVKYYAGDMPVFTLAYDMNADNNVDLLFANDQSNDVSIRLGNANGTFQGAVTFATGANPRTVCVGDFNGDGLKDFAAGNGNGNSMSVFLATSVMNFASPATYSLGSNISPKDMVAARMNSDTILDILVVDQQNSQVLLLIGNGNGTFQNALSYGADKETYGMAVADFNNDGANDFAAVNRSTNNVTVVLNNNAFITASGTTNICTGQDVTLSASSGYSYLWSTGATTSSITVNTADVYTVSITNQSGTCTSVPPSVTVSVSSGPNVIFNTALSGPKCVTDGNINLASVAGQPQGGTYSGNFVSNGIFNASAAGVGAHVVTYSYTDGCGTDSESDTIFVDSEVLASINFPSDTFCDNVGQTLLAPYGLPAGGVWGVNNNVVTSVNPSQAGPGTYLLHYTIVAGGCRDTAYVNVEVITCTGIEEMSDMSFSVYPNPSNGNFVIDIQNDQKFSVLKITDLAGRYVFEQQLAGEKVITCSTSLSAGVYLVQLLSDNGSLSKRVMIE